MDHSPSEQLGAADAWHTTALVLSESAEQWDLGNTIAGAMGVQSGRLKKWSKYNIKQKTRFENELCKALKSSSICVTAVSAQASVMELQFHRMLQDLRLAGLVNQTSRNEKAYLEFGPFVKISKNGSTSEVVFPILRARAVPLIFITHFIVKAHQNLLHQLHRNDHTIDWMDWRISGDIFPGGIAGQMSLLFFALMDLMPKANIVRGNLSNHTHLQGDQGTELADNLAGMLQDKIATASEVHDLIPMQRAIRPHSLAWERWMPEQTRTE